jgi:hypothetical protein
VLGTWETEIGRLMVWSLARTGKTFTRPHLNQYLGMVVCACDFSIVAGWDLEDWVQDGLGKNQDPTYLQNNQSKKGLRSNSSSKVSS